MKKCIKCLEVRELNMFFNCRTRKDGKYPYCKLCRKEIDKNIIKDEKRKRLDSMRKLKHRYGLSIADYEKMLEKQGGVCAICFKSDNNRRLTVDHCHKTGKIRALLCNKCNTCAFPDDIEMLQKRIDYLKLHTENLHVVASR